VPWHSRVLWEIADGRELGATPAVDHRDLAEANRPTPRPQISNKRADQRRLARTIQSDQRRNAGLEGTRDVKEHLASAVSLPQALDGDVSTWH